MSATINENKLKFSVFGKGFEDTRSDSGEGADSDYRDIGHGCACAIIDSTDTYFWWGQTAGSYPFEWCTKRRLSDLQQLNQTIVPNDRATVLLHPSNTDNNIGVAIQDKGQNVYVFDMTDDTLYCHITSTVTNMQNDKCDCIIVDDKIYICERNMFQTTNRLWCIDLTNETFATYGTIGESSVGFVDNDTWYAFHQITWFSDSRRISGFSFDGNVQWSVTAPLSGDAGFPHLEETGLSGNGFLYLPVEMYGAWRLGMFRGNSTSDFQTPKPLRTFGKFNSRPAINTQSPPYYSNERANAIMLFSDGLFVTDFKDVTFITNETWFPKAIGNKYVIARNYYNNTTRIFEYR